MESLPELESDEMNNISCQKPVIPPKRDRAQMASYLGTVKPWAESTRSSPSFGGAVAWLKRHRYELSTSLRLMQVYPNVMQDEAVDCMWDFMEPFLEALVVNRQNKKHIQTSKSLELASGDELSSSSSTISNGSNPSLPPSMPTMASVRLYFCHQRPDGSDSLELAKVDILERALLPFCYIRDSSSPYAPWLPSRRDAVNSITDCDVFIFILNDLTLQDEDCLDMLHKAHSSSVPVVMIRDPGYNLPHTYSEISKNKTSKSSKGKGKSSRGSTEDESKYESNKTNSEHVIRHDSLIKVIKDGYENAVVYVLDFHEACICRLYDKLTAIVGPGTFPNNHVMNNNRNKLQFVGLDYVKTDQYIGANNPIDKLDQSTIVLKAVKIGSPRLGVKTGQLVDDVSQVRRPFRRKDSRIRVSSAGELPRRPPNPGENKRKSKPHLPPLSTATLPDASGAPPKTLLSRRPSGDASDTSEEEAATDEDSQSEFSIKEATYLLFKRPGEKPDVIRWPLKKDTRRRDSLFFPLTDDEESDSSLTIEVVPSDIEIHSEFSTPEPDEYEVNNT